MQKIRIQFKLNGQWTTVETQSNRRLIDLLREDLGLTGTKEGCSVGECGACTILLNGQSVHSCLILAPQVDGAEVLTVEGLARGDQLHPLQKNFLEYGAVQCGFCIPGMLLSSYALLKETKNPNQEQIKEAIAGNLCRCTGYKQIIKAIEVTAKEIDPT